VTGFGGLSCSLSPFKPGVPSSVWLGRRRFRPGTPGWLNFGTVQIQYINPRHREPGQTGTNHCTRGKRLKVGAQLTCVWKGHFFTLTYMWKRAKININK
jgi:hypothetical protein